MCGRNNNNLFPIGPIYTQVVEGNFIYEYNNSDNVLYISWHNFILSTQDFVVLIVKVLNT